MSKPSRALFCIVCGAGLKNVLDGGCQPVDGLALSSPGHYGCTVFDPLDGTQLEVCVCDSCLVSAAKKGRVLIARYKPAKDSWAYRRWLPHHSPRLT